MTWVLVAYLLGLLYFLANPQKVADRAAFRTAWKAFALVPVANMVFALFRAGNMRSGSDLALVEVWSDGIAWLLLGISFFCLIDALLPGDSK